jgi:pyoverdine/dityrosine biosynthesis protein Dit1
LEKLASDILDVIARYGQHIAPKDGEEHRTEWIGKPMFKVKVLHQLEKGEPIKMILPAFPWKSVSHPN